MTEDSKIAAPRPADGKRRAALKHIGRFAAVTPPAIALLLAGTAKPSRAQPSSTPK